MEQEVPDLAAEEIVTIDGDDSSQSSDISLNHPLQPFTTHTGQSRESEHSYVNYSYDDNDSNDVVSLIVDMLGESDSGSMSGVRVESDDSSDDQSVIISDSDSNQMVRTSSSDSIDSVDDRAEEPHTHASEQPPVMDSALSSAVSADVAATSSNTGLLGTDSRPQTLTSVDLDSSLECFRSKQTKNVLPGPSEDCRKDYSVLEAGEDGESCPICFETWTNSGLHRLASLRCGHLFGQSCIEKWLKGQTGKCPQCNAKAHRKDIRVIFARSLKTVDTTERDRALEELEKEKEARRNAELEAAKARMHHQMAINECHQLRQELERQRQQVELLKKSCTGKSEGVATNLGQSGSQSTSCGTFVFEKHIKMSESGGCRVLTYCSQMATLCISQQSANALFPGFGVKKVSALDFKTSEFVWVHSKAIRDLSFNSRTSDATLLSCSIDKSIRLTSLHSNKIIQTYDCQHPVWSCTWNASDKNYLYAGLQNGSVFVFDVRNLSEPVQQLNQDATSRSPVVSLQYLPQNPALARPGGLLVGQLDRSTFYERRASGEYKIHLLPLEANLTSLSLEESTGHLLASYRPSARCPNVRHQVCELAVQSTFSDDSSSVVTDCTCRSVHTFYSGATQKLLARSRLFISPAGDLLACAGDEASLSVCVWNAGTGQLQQKTSTSDPVIDVCPVAVNNHSFLAALTEKVVNIYRWQ